MTSEEIDTIFSHILDYICYRVDIISNNPNKWLHWRHKPLLPSFEYYMKNCVLDKGGDYDFTVRRYGSTACVKNLEIKDSFIHRQRKIIMTCEYSIWMGTPFNFHEEIKDY